MPHEGGCAGGGGWPNPKPLPASAPKKIVWGGVTWGPAPTGQPAPQFSFSSGARVHSPPLPGASGGGGGGGAAIPSALRPPSPDMTYRTSSSHYGALSPQPARLRPASAAATVGFTGHRACWRGDCASPPNGALRATASADMTVAARRVGGRDGVAARWAARLEQETGARGAPSGGRGGVGSDSGGNGGSGAWAGHRGGGGGGGGGGGSWDGAATSMSASAAHFASSRKQPPPMRRRPATAGRWKPSASGGGAVDAAGSAAELRFSRTFVGGGAGRGHKAFTNTKLNHGKDSCLLSGASNAAWAPLRAGPYFNTGMSQHFAKGTNASACVRRLVAEHHGKVAPRDTLRW